MADGWVSRLFKSLDRDQKQGQSTPDQDTGAGQESGGGNPAPRTPPEPLPNGEPLYFTWHGVTDRGRVRPQNEDSFSCVTFGEWSLFVVADGMGGHDAGEVASRIAVETVCREIGEGMEQQGHALLGLIEHAVQQANRLVNREGASKGSNMGTTLSLALLTGNTASIASVGDSRVYWTENGSLTQVTQDHSLVASLVKAGELTKEGARNHPRSNILYRTVGRPEKIAVDTFQVELKKGGILMLCTDGLWNEVSDEEICQVLAADDDPRSASEKLVGVAKEQGGRDNITAVVVRID